MKQKKLSLIVASMIASGAYANNSLAQDGNVMILDEIIVTASKREQSLQDVPISVAVTDGEDLSKLNFSEATDLQYLAPSLSLGDSNSPRGAGFRIRGIGTQVFAEGVEQSVGTVIDGIPLARAGQGLADLIDVERVEVLRGPQGMLFGRNASAGLINVITKKPSQDKFGFEGRVGYGTDADFQAAASVTGPLSDTTSFRLTGFSNTRDGFVDNTFNGKELNDRDEKGLRGTLMFTPNENLEVVVRGDWAERENQGNIWTIRSLAADSPLLSTAPPLGPFAGPAISSSEVLSQIGEENTTVNFGGEVFNEITNYGVSSEINYTAGEYVFSSITGYREWEQFDNNDADQSPFNILDVNNGFNELDQFSQEFRITSPADQRVSYVGGLFYYKSSNEIGNSRTGRFANIFAQAAAIGAPLEYSALGIPLPGALLPNELGGVDTSGGNVSVEDIAIFGEATVNLTDRLNLILGGRYTDTTVDGRYQRRSPAGTSPIFNAILGPNFSQIDYDLTADDTNFSWRTGLQFSANDDLTMYATVSRGYKGPGFDTQIDFNFQPGRTAFDSAFIEPEIPTSIEAGLRGFLAEGRIDYSVTVFQTDFENFQAQVFETPADGGLGAFAIRNAGELRTQGVEFSFNGSVTENLIVGINAAYADAEYNDFAGAACTNAAGASTVAGNPCANEATSFDASGVKAPIAPEWTAALNARYDASLSDNIDIYALGNAYYRSETFFNLTPNGVPNPYKQDSYVIVNASLGLSFNDGKYTVALYAKNLFDENFVNQIFDLPFGDAGDYGQFVTRDAQRTIGIQARVKY